MTTKTGRKKLAENETTKGMSLKLPESLFEYVKNSGGSKFVRELIEAHKRRQSRLTRAFRGDRNV